MGVSRGRFRFSCVREVPGEVYRRRKLAPRWGSLVTFSSAPLERSLTSRRLGGRRERDLRHLPLQAASWAPRGDEHILVKNLIRLRLQNRYHSIEFVEESKSTPECACS